MICGSPAMLKEISAMLDGFGFGFRPTSARRATT
jgi:NAD(P)H-flavin reductase